ncbi:hypothetical protein [Microbacterium hominis]|uniref:Secreted protein n=1 Tax=Microbacterium hominis TaxID=162426 RepID=A0A0B4CW08_9MICO|nr:hypothetical protein [Microbacterium hominis]KIC58526.1 hypothetical protein RM52_05705 [Microbacterium hominis]
MTRMTDPRTSRARRLTATAILAATLALTGGAAAPAFAEMPSDPAPPDAVTTSDYAAHHIRTVTLSTLMRRSGDVVTSVLLQGPDPATGRPGWSHCVDLPQSGLPIWVDLPVRLAYPGTYTASSYSDFACSDGYNYRWSTGTIDTRFTHWIVYTGREPRLSLR